MVNHETTAPSFAGEISDDGTRIARDIGGGNLVWDTLPPDLITYPNWAELEQGSFATYSPSHGDALKLKNTQAASIDLGTPSDGDEYRYLLINETDRVTLTTTGNLIVVGGNAVSSLPLPLPNDVESPRNTIVTIVVSEGFFYVAGIPHGGVNQATDSSELLINERNLIVAAGDYVAPPPQVNGWFEVEKGPSVTGSVTFDLGSGPLPLQTRVHGTANANGTGWIFTHASAQAVRVTTSNDIVHDDILYYLQDGSNDGIYMRVSPTDLILLGAAPSNGPMNQPPNPTFVGNWLSQFSLQLTSTATDPDGDAIVAHEWTIDSVVVSTSADWTYDASGRQPGSNFSVSYRAQDDQLLWSNPGVTVFQIAPNTSDTVQLGTPTFSGGIVTFPILNAEDINANPLVGPMTATILDGEGNTLDTKVGNWGDDPGSDWTSTTLLYQTGLVAAGGSISFEGISRSAYQLTLESQPGGNQDSDTKDVVAHPTLPTPAAGYTRVTSFDGGQVSETEKDTLNAGFGAWTPAGRNQRVGTGIAGLTHGLENASDASSNTIPDAKLPSISGPVYIDYPITTERRCQAFLSLNGSPNTTGNSFDRNRPYRFGIDFRIDPNATWFDDFRSQAGTKPFLVVAGIHVNTLNDEAGAIPRNPFEMDLYSLQDAGKPASMQVRIAGDDNVDTIGSPTPTVFGCGDAGDDPTHPSSWHQCVGLSNQDTQKTPAPLQEKEFEQGRWYRMVYEFTLNNDGAGVSKVWLDDIDNFAEDSGSLVFDSVTQFGASFTNTYITRQDHETDQTATLTGREPQIGSSNPDWQDWVPGVPYGMQSTNYFIEESPVNNNPPLSTFTGQFQSTFNLFLESTATDPDPADWIAGHEWTINGTLQGNTDASWVYDASSQNIGDAVEVVYRAFDRFGLAGLPVQQDFTIVSGGNDEVTLGAGTYDSVQNRITIPITKASNDIGGLVGPFTLDIWDGDDEVILSESHNWGEKPGDDWGSSALTWYNSTAQGGNVEEGGELVFGGISRGFYRVRITSAPGPSQGIGENTALTHPGVHPLGTGMGRIQSFDGNITGAQAVQITAEFASFVNGPKNQFAADNVGGMTFGVRSDYGTFDNDRPTCIKPTGGPAYFRFPLSVGLLRSRVYMSIDGGTPSAGQLHFERGKRYRYGFDFRIPIANSVGWWDDFKLSTAVMTLAQLATDTTGDDPAANVPDQTQILQINALANAGLRPSTQTRIAGDNRIDSIHNTGWVCNTVDVDGRYLLCYPMGNDHGGAWATPTLRKQEFEPGKWYRILYDFILDNNNNGRMEVWYNEIDLFAEDAGSKIVENLAVTNGFIVGPDTPTAQTAFELLFGTTMSSGYTLPQEIHTDYTNLSLEMSVV